MLNQQVLDLDRIDFVPAAVDHILLAVEDAHVTVLALTADIS